MRYLLLCAGILGAAAVAAGALTAHGLPSILEKRGVAGDEIPQRLSWAESAVRYQLVHALAMLATVTLALRFPDAWLLRLAAVAFLIGMLLFSGSLMTLSLTGNRIFARIAPWGGMALIAAWLLVGLGGLLATESS